MKTPRATLLGVILGLWALLLCLAGDARVTVGESNIFAFDTRDSNSEHYADSPPFLFDTRASNSTHYGESAAFAFNTRAFDGLTRSQVSGNFVFDTRNVLMTELVVSAPSNVGGGTAVDLTATCGFRMAPPTT